MRKSTLEQYLKTIHSLQSDGNRVRNGDLAQSLGVGRSSVSEFCRKLRDDGLILWEPHQGIALTEEGRRIACKVKQRYMVILSFLRGIGVEREEASLQACRMEHVLSGESVERLRMLMGKYD